MTESEFWLEMEYRICRELQGFGDPVLKHSWCDGICGGLARPDDAPPYILGTVWLGDDGQTEGSVWD